MKTCLTLVALILLAACGGTTPAPAVIPPAAPPTSIPPATAPPTPIPPTVAPTHSIATSTGSLGQFEGLSTGLDDTKQARLRIAHFVQNGPHVDEVINDKILVIAGQPQINMPSGYVNAYVYLPPGTYSVAILPTGTSLADAMIGPLDVTLSAGHRYTVVMTGQIAGHRFKPLVIDETAELSKVRTSPNQNFMLMVNNLTGSKTLDWGVPDETQYHVPYGTVGVGERHVGPYRGFLIYANGDPKNYLDGDGESINDGEYPGIDQLIGTWGTYANGHVSELGGGASQPISDLSLLDLLQTFHGVGVRCDGRTLSFDTFLLAVKQAGLQDLLSNGKPYLVLAPTDEAFAAMSQAEHDRFFSDPHALADLLKNHIVGGYVPRGSLSKTPGGPFNRTFTNLLGNPITIGDGYAVNGADIGGCDSFFIANGTQFHAVSKVFIPSK